MSATQRWFQPRYSRIYSRVWVRVGRGARFKFKEGSGRSFDLWSSVGQLHRMWPRLYQGGSVQVVKLGPKEQLLEQRGFPMNRFRYFRLAQIEALAAAYAALGAHFSRLELESYDELREEATYLLCWA
jgi:hypothetical protein